MRRKLIGLFVALLLLPSDAPSPNLTPTIASLLMVMVLATLLYLLWWRWLLACCALCGVLVLFDGLYLSFWWNFIVAIGVFLGVMALALRSAQEMQTQSGIPELFRWGSQEADRELIRQDEQGEDFEDDDDSGGNGADSGR